MTETQRDSFPHLPNVVMCGRCRRKAIDVTAICKVRYCSEHYCLDCLAILDDQVAE